MRLVPLPMPGLTSMLFRSARLSATGRALGRVRPRPGNGWFGFRSAGRGAGQAFRAAEITHGG
jgi:hypothetical protein